MAYILFGNTSVHHPELVSKHTADTVARVLGQIEGICNINALVFHKVLPKKDKAERDMLGISYPLLETIGVGLMRHYQDAVAATKIMDTEVVMRMDMIMWYNLLLTVLHEAKHCGKVPTESCEEAQQYAEDVMVELAAAGIPMEMPNWEDEPVLGALVKEYRRIISQGNEPWMKIQRDLFDQGVMWRTEEGIEAHSLRDILRNTDAAADQVWVDAEEPTGEPIEEVIENTSDVPVPNPTQELVLVSGTAQTAHIIMAKALLRMHNQLHYGCASTTAGFNKPEAIANSIELPEGIDSLIASFDTKGPAGHVPGVKFLGNDLFPRNHIAGLTTAVAGFPCYQFYVKINGKLMKRHLLPQNPEKDSEPGKACRGGAKISWLYREDGNPAKYAAKIWTSGGKTVVTLIAPDHSEVMFESGLRPENTNTAMG